MVRLSLIMPDKVDGHRIQSKIDLILWFAFGSGSTLISAVHHCINKLSYSAHVPARPELNTGLHDAIVGWQRSLSCYALIGLSSACTLKSYLLSDVGYLIISCSFFCVSLILAYFKSIFFPSVLF